MSPERYSSILDVHMLLRRDGKILLLRRAGDTWASGQLCLPSGHVEEGENILHAVIRETGEECGLAFAAESLRLALSIHQRHPGTSHARVGFAFEPIGPWHAAGGCRGRGYVPAACAVRPGSGGADDQGVCEFRGAVPAVVRAERTGLAGCGRGLVAVHHVAEIRATGTDRHGGPGSSPPAASSSAAVSSG
jgi:8-oxo-dGTP pyrophosphatase MutT (NUDIX family)